MTACVARERGSEPWLPSDVAMHPFFSGHETHLGDFGKHTVAPSSITAWFHSPGFEFAIRSNERDSHSLSVMLRPKNRQITRLTLPSTHATLSPKAMLAIALDVYLPIPGSCVSPSAVLGAACFEAKQRLLARL